MRNATLVLLVLVLLPALSACLAAPPCEPAAASPPAVQRAPSAEPAEPTAPTASPAPQQTAPSPAPSPSKPAGVTGLPTLAPGEVRIVLVSPNGFPVQNAPIMVNIGEAQFPVYGPLGGALVVTLAPEEYAALAKGASVTVGGAFEGPRLVGVLRHFGVLRKGALRGSEIQLEEDFLLEQQDLLADLVEAQAWLGAEGDGDWLALAVAHLEKTLEPSLWRQGSRLDLRAGQSFFEETEAAALLLAQGIEEAGDRQSAMFVGMYAKRLADITSGVIWYAAVDPTEAALREDVLREIVMESDTAWAAGMFLDYRNAFVHYRKAWDLATTRD